MVKLLTLFKLVFDYRKDILKKRFKLINSEYTMKDKKEKFREKETQ